MEEYGCLQVHKKYKIDIFLFSDRVQSLEQIWISGDGMVNRTGDEHLLRAFNTSAGTKFFMKEQFDVKLFASDRYTSNNPSLICRMRNHLVEAINQNILLPKLIVVIFDRDFIATISHDDCGISFICGIDINWLAKEFSKIIQCHKDRLPNKSKVHDAPKFIWMQAPLHSGFTDNPRRVKFNKSLQHIISFHADMTTMKMVKEWDYSDSSIFVTEAKRFTSQGLKQYWSSIDSAIEHWCTYLSRRPAANEYRQKSKFGKPNFVKRLKFDFSNRSKDSKFNWNSKDQKKRRQLPKPPQFT